MAKSLYPLIIVMVVSWFVAPPVTAQNLEQNLDKYWQYRHKLVTQYMHIGDEQGYSLPASYISPTLERMKWTDNTIWLGWYIGTLATEYHLLHNTRFEGYADGDSTQRKAENLNELYYALKAIIRLDENAESFFPSPCTTIANQRNGFFLRDDVPLTMTDSFPGYSVVHSDYIDFNYMNEMSQDQAYHVLLGLALVKKFVPDTVEVNGFNLHDEAVQQALLIGGWIHQDNWIIKNPACGNKDVDRGHDASLLARGLSNAMLYLSDGSVDYGNDVSTLGDFAWTNLANPSPLVTTDNLHMTMTLASIGEGWGATTLDNLVALSDTNKWFAYPLLYIALRDTNSVGNYAQHKSLIHLWADSMLNEAPFDGPLSTYPNQNGHGYGVNNRFIRPRVNHYAGNNPNEAGHQWNGLDYMLLHNLQLIVDPNKWPEEEPLTPSVKELPTRWGHIYPNPAKDLLTIQLETSGVVNFQLLDIAGKEIMAQPVVSHLTVIQLNGLQQGIYVVRLTDSRGQQANHKLAIANP